MTKVEQDALVAAVEELLGGRLLRSRRADLVAAAERAAATGHDVLASLRDGDRAALHDLISASTINETYFFRTREHFEALRTGGLAELVGPDGRVRAWSAACSTGAEPWTLAMVAEEALGPGRLDVVGTDVDASVLSVAREGRYGPWALRTLDDDERSRRFDPAPDGRVVVPSRLRDAVRFLDHNLVTDSAPGIFDLVLCRNVLIYLDEEAQRAVARLLTGSLRPGGVLMVAPAEYRPSLFPDLDAVVWRGTLVLRRPAVLRRDRTPSVPTTTTGPSAVAPRLVEAAAPAPDAPRPLVGVRGAVTGPTGLTPAVAAAVATPGRAPQPETTGAAPTDARSPLALVEEALTTGSVELAVVEARRLAATHPRSPSALLVLASALFSVGATERAVATAGRAERVVEGTGDDVVVADPLAPTPTSAGQVRTLVAELCRTAGGVL